jgi:ubiquinone/menaquinone biosynthesis C-methylase UbiE
VVALPDYDDQLSAFHEAFVVELRGIVASLPLTPSMRVLDLACGDGFYTQRLAARLGLEGSVTGVDLNPASLSKAKRQTSRCRFVLAGCERLPFADGTFDFVWCAQSLYSLPDLLLALGEMARVLRPGGVLAVLENDSLHTVLLPWPASLELHLRAAELRAFQHESRPASRYYVGRRLPTVLASAGLEPLELTTHAFDRQAPLADIEQRLLQEYLREVETRVSPFLEAASLEALHALVDPNSPQHLLRMPHLSLTWVNVLALGRKP